MASNTTGKRDKRRHGIAMRINYISEQFEADRDVHYRDMLHALQSTLSSLHTGNNEEFLEQLADLEEHRDEELTRLNLWESYQIDRTEREYQREISAANEEYTKMTLLVRERLMNHLESQRKRLREDKTLLDIANDHLVFLSGSYGYSPSGDASNNVPNGNANGNGSANGYYSGGASGTPHSPGPSFALSSERRSLRRRDNGSALEDASGMSGGEGKNGGDYGSAAARGTGSAGRGDGGATSTGGAKRRKVGSRAVVSGEDTFLSDRDALEGLLFNKGKPVAASGAGNGRQSRSYQPPAGLKNEDVQDDLNQLRIATTPLKRKR